VGLWRGKLKAKWRNLRWVKTFTFNDTVYGLDLRGQDKHRIGLAAGSDSVSVLMDRILFPVRYSSKSSASRAVMCRIDSRCEPVEHDGSWHQISNATI
jgi:hypothetical protein